MLGCWFTGWLGGWFGCGFGDSSLACRVTGNELSNCSRLQTQTYLDMRKTYWRNIAHGCVIGGPGLTFAPFHPFGPGVQLITLGDARLGTAGAITALHEWAIGCFAPEMSCSITFSADITVGTPDRTSKSKVDSSRRCDVMYIVVIWAKVQGLGLRV